MARKDAIKEGARKALEEFNADTNLSYIRQTIGLLSKEEKKLTCADAALGDYTNLRLAIEENDFLTMRLYEKNNEMYFETFLKCAGKIAKMDLGLFGGYAP
jgi:hypothetical protein